jgi:hypothetical protein
MYIQPCMMYVFLLGVSFFPHCPCLLNPLNKSAAPKGEDCSQAKMDLPSHHHIPPGTVITVLQELAFFKSHLLGTDLPSCRDFLFYGLCSYPPISSSDVLSTAPPPSRSLVSVGTFLDLPLRIERRNISLNQFVLLNKGQGRGKDRIS